MTPATISPPTVKSRKLPHSISFRLKPPLPLSRIFRKENIENIQSQSDKLPVKI